MKRLLLPLLLAALASFAGAQVQNTPTGVISVAGGTAANCMGASPTAGSCVLIPNNYGAYGISVEEKPTGAPTGVSVTIQGCMRGGTCDSAADTNVSTSAAIRGVTFTKVYDVFVIVAGTLSGGTSPTIVINPKLTTANNHAAGGGSFTAGGDLSGTSSLQTVIGINGVSLSGLATGLLKNTTATGVPSIAVAGTDYQAPLSGTGLVRQTGVGAELSGDATTSGSNAVTVIRLNGTSLAGLATGLLKNTTATGVPSIAGSADILAACTTCTTNAAALTANSLVLGNGTTTAKTVAGFVTNGTNELDLGVAASGNGVLGLSGNTSGKATFTAPAVAGTVTNPVTMSNGLLGPDGSNAAPTYSFTNSTGTGMRQISNILAFFTSGNTDFSVGRGTTGNIENIAGGVFSFSSSTDPTIAQDTAVSRSAAAVVAFGSGVSGDETALLRWNTCKPTSAIVLSTASATICTWTLPAVAKTWSWHCAGIYSITAGTTPAFGLGMNAAVAPTSETGSGRIDSITAGSGTIVETGNTATSTSSGNQSIITGGVVTTVTNAQWTSFGTIQASATGGTFAITGILTGTTPAGTVNVGSSCMLF